jgi:RNA ligase
MKLKELFDFALLHQMVNDRMVAITRHPDDDLFILNYTPKAQYQGAFNPVIKQCRGLVVRGNPLTDETSEIVARPFPRFLNVGEHSADNEHGALPNRPFEVFEKMDGSLGILYEAIDGPAIATRGSFSSEQALWATAFFRKTYPGCEKPLGETLLFEIIYPDNRIVVDYGNAERLVLLARIDTETGADLPIDASLFPLFDLVKRYDGLEDMREITALMAVLDGNDEGFVIRFEPETPDTPSVRAKAKGAEYVRLHRIVTGVNAKTIWEALSTGQSLDELLDRVPDEFYQWVKNTKLMLENDFMEMWDGAHVEFDKRPIDADRKALAQLWQSSPHRSLLFRLLDDRPIDDLIWKQLKPEATKPFRVDDDA